MAWHAGLWSSPPGDLTLRTDELHVWRASLVRPAAFVARLRNTLARDELQRAGRFHFPKDEQHYIVARGLLRAILGRYLGLAPAKVCFSYNAYGKPAVTPAQGRAGLQFNVSHSDGLVLYAVTHGREVGIDIECVRADIDYSALARQYFSPSEIAVIWASPPERRKDLFFRYWVRKEAYVKARGVGLSRTLDHFDVSLLTAAWAELADTEGDLEETSRWSLRDLAVGPHYAAALAVKGSSGPLKCWQWSE